MVGTGYNGPQARQDRFQGVFGGEADLRGRRGRSAWAWGRDDRLGGYQGDEGDHDHEEDDLGGADRRPSGTPGDRDRTGVERVAKRRLASGQKRPGW
jgi:hypothetical protein